MSTYESIMSAIDKKHLPTQEQRPVIVDREPVMMVVAGAGSGKTATMANRIAYHVQMGHVSADEVLGLTFTRKAAAELDERVDKALKAASNGVTTSDLRKPMITTYNSFASDIAATYGLLIGAPGHGRLINDAERNEIMREVAKQHGGGDDMPQDAKLVTVVKVALALSESLIDNDVSVEEARVFFDEEREALDSFADDKRQFRGDLKELKPHFDRMRKAQFDLRLGVLPLVEAYWNYKRTHELVEFVDQVATARGIVTAYPEIGQEISAAYPLVLLDEYQDTSVGQAAFLVRALGQRLGERKQGQSSGESPATILAAGSHAAQHQAKVRSICAVGDPNQAIYGWRGASANALAEFADSFGRSMGAEPRTYNLSTSFRSDKAILKAANAVAAPLHQEGVTVRTLQPRDGAGGGRVIDAHVETREHSYQAAAERIRDVFAEVAADPERENAEIAVLCRKRAYMDRMADVLTDYGIPFEVVGGTSLLQRPEILTVRAALSVPARPQQNRALARLFLHWGIGSHDLRAIVRWRDRYALTAEAQGLGNRREIGLIEALFAADTEITDLSTEGLTRFRTIRSVVDALGTSLHLPLPDLVARAIELLGLDVAAASRAAGSQRVRTSLDSFIALARTYSTDHPGCSVSEFLDWLDDVDEYEHTGEEASGDDVDLPSDVEVNPGVVQLMTVHAAKGLQWRDLVVIPELVDTEFSIKLKAPELWTSQNLVFPNPLRLDRDYLPHFRISDTVDKFEAAEAFAQFYGNTLERAGQEMRRLAYVAFTRPTLELMLLSYGSKISARGELKKVARSAFVESILESVVAEVATLDKVATEEWPMHLRCNWEWVDALEAARADLLNAGTDDSPNGGADTGSRGGADAGSTDRTGACPTPGEAETHTDDRDGVPLGDSVSEQNIRGEDESSVHLWPRDIVRGPGLRPAQLGDEELADIVQDYLTKLADGPVRTPGPAYLTASDVVRIATDAEAFEHDRIRPIPQRPSRAGRIGTELHAQIASHFSGTTMSGIEELDDEDQEAWDSSVTELFEAFLRTPWAGRTALAIENQVTVDIGGEPIRCTIDAVFDTSSIPGEAPVTIVDWKSGRRPSGDALKARELQLAIYRLAWARTHNIPVEDIGTVFFYLRDGSEVRAQPMTEDEIIERMRGTTPTAQ